MVSLKLHWGHSSINNPPWEQISQAIEDAKVSGGNVTIYNLTASDPGVDSLILEVDEDISMFQPVLMLNPVGMRSFENRNGSAERIEFNGSEAVTGAITDDLPTVLRLAKEFYETGDVKEMKAWKDLFFNSQAG